MNLPLLLHSARPFRWPPLLKTQRLQLSQETQISLGLPTPVYLGLLERLTTNIDCLYDGINVLDINVNLVVDYGINSVVVLVEL